MNPAHLHLVVNHLPIVGTVFGLLILLTGMILRNPSIKKTAAGVFVLSAIFAAIAFSTGEGAEETVEGLPGVSEAMIGQHEDIADLFLLLSGITGILALFTLIADVLKWKFITALYIVTALSSAGALVLAKQVGTSGGAIRHTEIRADAANANGTDVSNSAAETGGGEESDEDDD